jgi:hypothetical protein
LQQPQRPAGAFATFAKIACTAVAKYGGGLPLRNVQVFDLAALGDTEVLANALLAEKGRFRQFKENQSGWHGRIRAA